MGYLSVLLLIIAIVTFIQGKGYIALLVLVALITSYFGFVDGGFYLGPLSLQHGDLALLLIFGLLPLTKIKSQIKLQGIQTALLLFLIFLVISIGYDYFYRGTSFGQIFRTTRRFAYLMFFFLLPAFKWSDYKILLKFLVGLTVVHSGLYISQYIFGYSYTPHLDVLYGRTNLNELGEARFSNIPPFLVPTLVMTIFLNFLGKLKWYAIGLLVLAIVLGQGRGAIISMVVILFSYLILEKGINWINIIFYPILLSVIGVLFLSYFPILGERFSNLFNEVLLIQQMNYDNLNAFYHEGSFIFRLGLTYERLLYVLESPVRMLLGVGYLPDMDITRPIFILGTKSDVLPTGFEQYNTVDILFPNILTRYGLLGSAIFLFLIYKILAFSFKYRMFKWGKILFTYLVGLAIISFVNDTFYKTENFVLIFLLLRVVLIECAKFKLISGNINKIAYS